MKKPSCETCMYCQTESAECRFSPPTAGLSGQLHYVFWPKVMLDGTHWCGQWRDATPDETSLEYEWVG